MSIFKFWQSVVCFAWMPLYIGGSSESDSHTDTTNNTTNNVSSTDKRAVASDAAIGITGDKNAVDRSTNFADSSSRSTTINNTTTDFGSVAKALDSVTLMGKSALEVSDHSVQGAISSLNKTGANNLTAVLAAFDSARAQSADSVRTTQDALQFASKTTALTNEAFAAAKNGPDTNKTVMIVGLAVVGVVGAAIAFKGK